MCETCGCGDPEIVPVEVHERDPGRQRRARRRTTASTSESRRARDQPDGLAGLGQDGAARGHRARVVGGDAAPRRDQRRSRHRSRRASGCAPPASRRVAITTGSACHLDAEMVHHALHHIAVARSSTCLFIENVGNLVCPAIYDLGQAANVVALSVTEGEDKPLKYPVMFRRADLVLLTKIDLLPHLPTSTSARSATASRG